VVVADWNGVEENAREVAVVRHGAAGRVRKGARNDEVVNLHKVFVAFEMLRDASMAD